MSDGSSGRRAPHRDPLAEAKGTGITLDDVERARLEAIPFANETPRAKALAASKAEALRELRVAAKSLRQLVGPLLRAVPHWNRDHANRKMKTMLDTLAGVEDSITGADDGSTVDPDARKRRR